MTRMALAKDAAYDRAKAMGKAYLGHTSYIKECECLYRHVAERMTNADMETYVKTKWTQKIPDAEGWYWCRVRAKYGMTTKPCEVVHFRSLGSIICVARVGDFPIHTETRKADLRNLRKANLTFGPRIPAPCYKKKKARTTR